MRIAVVCASGIGDALILHSISNLLRQKGWEVTTYNNHLPSFGNWLPGFRFAPQPSDDQIQEIFPTYDALFLQHDNSRKAAEIKALPMPVYAFYGAHIPIKHGPIRKDWDYVCDRNQSMVENVAMAAELFFGERCIDNGFQTPVGLIYRRFPKRIAIHPTASSEEKIWPREKFLIVAESLRKNGYDPIFTVSPSERSQWDGPLFPTLGDLASFLYESGAFLGNDSGTGHLASCLQIPHLIVGGNGLQMPLWRTGWLPGQLAIPPPFLMQFKALRAYWKQFITTRSVTKKFKYRVLGN